MKWWRTMRTLWPFGAHNSTAQATNAVKAAELSQVQAFHDRASAAATRAVAEELEAQMRRHNSANRYDEFLQRAMRGEH